MRMPLLRNYDGGSEKALIRWTLRCSVCVWCLLSVQTRIRRRLNARILFSRAKRKRATCVALEGSRGNVELLRRFGTSDIVPKFRKNECKNGYFLGGLRI